ncbi:N-acetylmuramoyl-L-alanine amidase [Oscillospiraceae bacterium PP1C4]
MRVKKNMAVALILIGATVIFLASYSFRAITTAVPSFEEDAGLPTIVIDAGHGGIDGGAVGVDGIVEKNVNLSIALKLYDLFTINGFNAVLTRDKDISLHDESAKTVRKQKSSDLHNRFETAKSYPNSILLSIHQNKFGRSKSTGAQIFYGPKNPESAVFGEIMQRRFIEMLQPNNTRQYKPCGSNVFLIYNAPMPALLVECGFLSNSDEAHKLVTGEYQHRVAFTIFAGTVEYLGLEYQEETPSQNEEKGQ